MYERERERDAARLLSEAVKIELGDAIKLRAQYIEQHRPKMIADVRKEMDEGRLRLLAHLAKLPALREVLVDWRETLLWLASFPEQADAFGVPTAAALGLREPIERTLHTSALVQYTALLEALEEDAAALVDAFTAKQAGLLGMPVERTPVTEAMWDEDPDAVKWKKRELDRARGLLPWSSSPQQLADEARDFRPSPPELG